MQRSGPQFALNKDKDAFLLPPRPQTHNPIPRQSGIIDRIKRAAPDMVPTLVKEGLSYTMASPRTKRRILAHS